MIIKSSFRSSGGLAEHLERVDTNESVQILGDLFRGTPEQEVRKALRYMDGLAKTNSKAERSFVHIIMSPAHELSEPEISDAINLIEHEHGISAAVPRLAVKHLKGSRPAHFHLVYSIVDPSTGRAIKSHNNFERDEFISRLLELRFNEEIVPGPHLNKNIEKLRQRGLVKEAAALENYSPTRSGLRPKGEERQQAARLDVDGVEFEIQIFDAYESVGRDLTAFRQELAASGLALTQGDKAILVQQDNTGFQVPLGRLLRRVGKERGRSVTLSEAHLVAAYPSLNPADYERAAGLERSIARTGNDVEREYQIASFEVLADAELADHEALQTRHRQWKEEQAEAHRLAFKRTLKEKRELILKQYCERDEIRGRRVERAFRAAGLFDTPEMHRVAFSLAASGFLLTGAGLSMALLCAGIVVGGMPSFATAQAKVYDLKEDRKVERDHLQRDLRGAYEDTKAEFSRARSRVDLNAFEKRDRAILGFYGAEIMAVPSGAPLSPLGRMAELALGEIRVAAIKQLIEEGSERQLATVINWYRAIPEGGRSNVINAGIERLRVEIAEGSPNQQNASLPPEGPASDKPAVEKSRAIGSGDILVAPDAKAAPQKNSMRKTSKRKSGSLER